MHIALVTSGGAGMFCGSCMHDNTLARALLARGERVTLMPTYTPIRLDEADVSQRRVFLGGINVYLDARMPLWRRLPRVLTGWLDSPTIIRFATRWGGGVSSNAKQLGDLTVAMLRGDTGPNSREIDEFVAYVARKLKPDVVLYSNALLVGTLPALRRNHAGPIACLLQGDDVFLEDLADPWRSQSLEIIRAQARQFDAFLVHSVYYRDFMSVYLGLPRERMHVVPLGIDLSGHIGRPCEGVGRPFTVGYFARVCPEKGLHNLVAAFRKLHARQPQARLKAGGYLGVRDQDYFARVQTDARNLGSAFEYVGSPATHVEKVAFLRSLDVLSVPTDYREPKGLPILEAMANGVPVVQPRHGSFPEVIETTGGGLLVEPGDADALADALERLMLDESLRCRLAQSGYDGVRAHYGAAAMAERTLDVLKSL